jgi:ferredoxin--NADP+ reductase
MAFVIASPCIADYSCVEVCPVGAIGPTPDDPKFLEAEQLYINPAVCIDCEACVEACPVGAIFAADKVPARWKAAVKINAAHFSEMHHE